MNKKIVLVAFIMFVSCGKKHELENTFITNESEYWKYNNDCIQSRVYFKFYQNGNYDKYLRTYKGFNLFNNDGDIISKERTWSVKNDSTFVWSKEEYKIEKIGKQQIILSYHHYKVKDKICKVTLNKVKKGYKQ